MAEFIAINKKTGKEYGPYDEKKVQAIKDNPVTARSYTFKEVKGKASTSNIKPIGVKKEDKDDK